MDIALQVVSLLIVAWLPGAILFRAPFLERDRRAPLEAEERAFWAVVVSIAISLSAVLLLAALGQYSFSRLLVGNVLIAAAVAAAARGRLRMPNAKRLSWSAFMPLALLALAGWRFFPPAEYVIGGKDPGVYINEGIQIAQRGSLLIPDDTIASVPESARDLFFPRYFDLDGTPRRDYYSVRFMGFYILDPASGTVVGQFPHLFPASVAVGYGLHGLTGALWITGVWGAIGVLAVYFAGARLLGKPAAAIAAALLALNVAQVWFGRYPNSEIAMQALLFAAILAYARAHVDDVRCFAPVAGGLLGLLLFLRLDALLGIAAVAFAAFVGCLRGARVRLSFWIALAIPAVLACAYMTTVMEPYLYLYLVYVRNIPLAGYVTLAAIALAGGGLLVLARRNTAVANWITTYVPLLIASALVMAGLYALFLRQPGGRLATHDAYALRTFANLYFTVPAVLAALMGFWMMARDRFWRDPAIFFIVVIFAASVFYKIRIVPEHFWMARRFVPVVLPGALLFLSATAFASRGAGWRARSVRWAIGLTFVLLLASNYLRVSAPIRAQTEYEGLIPKIEALASRFGANDLVIVESRNAGGDVHVLAPPLGYIYAKHVLLLASPTPDKRAMAAFIAWARGTYDRVFFVGGGGTDLLARGYGVRPLASERFDVPEFELRTDALPRPSSRKFIFGIYEFVDAPGNRDGWFDLDVGSNDDLHVLRFNMSERADGTTFRWTNATSYVSITTFTASVRELTLVMKDGGRPPAADPAKVAVFLNDQRLGEIAVAPGPFRPYTLPVPADLAARTAASDEPVMLRLVSTLWNPREQLGSSDTRNLGVMVDRVTIK